MYEELDSVLSENVSEDSWYNDGFMYAQDLLRDFTAEDWKKLFQHIDSKDNKWKIKLAYSIDDDLGMNELKTLLHLLANDDVIETSIDSLRLFNSDECKI
ncbi:hypothetical protein AALF16_02450 [Bacillus cereus]|uniref:hypothetical protein n=1 Tax=Bacillus cereus TaxID=1396 RepID=UPI00356E1BB4